MRTRPNCSSLHRPTPHSSIRHKYVLTHTALQPRLPSTFTRRAPTFRRLPQTLSRLPPTFRRFRPLTFRRLPPSAHRLATFLRLPHFLLLWMKLLLPALRLPTPSQAGMLQTVGSLALGAACVALGMEADRKRESPPPRSWAVAPRLAHFEFAAFGACAQLPSGASTHA